MYLYVVSWSSPIGPRGWSLPVEIPTSAANPNSPPSANCVEALWTAIELLTSERNFLAVFLLFVTMESVWNEPYLFICFMASFTPLTIFTEIVGERYSVFQSFIVAILIFLEINFFIVLSPIILHSSLIKLSNILEMLT